MDIFKDIHSGGSYARVKHPQMISQAGKNMDGRTMVCVSCDGTIAMAYPMEK